jgi:hypothetical protein
MHSVGGNLKEVMLEYDGKSYREILISLREEDLRRNLLFEPPCLQESSYVVYKFTGVVLLNK